MSEQIRELVTDEIEFMRGRVRLEGARVVELGCGKADLARRLLERRLVDSVVAFEVDATQHEANLRSPPQQGLRFALGGAQDVPLPDSACDGVMMLKSLHHVPVDLMDRAFAEIRRILVPGGWLYVSEPVYAGDFNDIVKLFHDEGVVRAAAQAALRRAADEGVLAPAGEWVFDTPLQFRDFDDFVNRIVKVTHSDIELPDAIASEVRRRFEGFMTPGGARFVRQMRVTCMRR